jgi:AcrR family transcriptional regulator
VSGGAEFDRGRLGGLPAEVAMARLPSGRHGFSRSFVAENQRLRLLAAMLRLLPERGYPALTIGQITGEAAVSRASFYKQFESKEECYLATYDVASGWLCGEVEAAVGGIDGWEQRVRTGTAEALRLLAANPLVAHLVAVEAYRAGEAAQERQHAMLDRFASALRAGHPGRPELPDEMADLLLGGVVALVGRYVASGQAGRLQEATDAVVGFLLIPYVGGGEPGATLG